MNIYKGKITYLSGKTQKSVEFRVGNREKNSELVINSNISNIAGGYRFELDIDAQEDIEFVDVVLEAPVNIDAGSRIFLNGFQTWTESREFRKDDAIPKLSMMAPAFLKPYGDYTFYDYTGEPGKFQSWTYTYIRDEKNNLLLFGSATEAAGYTLFDYNAREGFLYIKKDLEGFKTQGSFKAADILVLSGTEDEVFTRYFQLVKFNVEAEEEQKRGQKNPFFDKGRYGIGPCTGWTSWYNYYTDITENIVIDNLSAFSKRNIPIDIFQIDDGYESAVGDWLKANDKFPKGMEYIASSIKSRGYKAGLWLAPFICEKKSYIFNRFKYWIINDEKGKPERAGYNPGWSGNFYALDFYNQEVRDYIREVFDTVFNDWGFDMVKLDFLYAAAIRPRKGRSRGMIMHEAMKFLRDISNDRIILGCGVPLGSCFGLVDYCRIGGDVALKWEDDLLNSVHYRERVSTINSLNSTIGRRHLNGNVFYNDPDAFIIRSNNVKLTQDERNTLLLMNMIFGGVAFTSDNLDEYSQAELDKYYSIFPFKEKYISSVTYEMGCYKIEFRIDDREYTAYANLENKDNYALLDEGIIYYSSATGFTQRDVPIILKSHQSICFLKAGGSYSVAGSRGHLFPGCEVDRIDHSAGEIRVEFSKKLLHNCEVYIRVPDNREVIVNGRLAKPEAEMGMYIIKLTNG